MLSNNIFLETRIQRLLDGLIFLKKDLACTCSACSKTVRVYILAEILSKILGKKRRKIGDLICVHDLTYLRFVVSLFFLLEYIVRSLLARLLPLHLENVD